MTPLPHELTLSQPPEAAFQAAHRRLVKSFDDVRVPYGWVDGPFCRVYLARTKHGLCRVTFGDEEDLVASLESMKLLPVKRPERLDGARRQLTDYLEGRRRSFRLAIDLRGVTDFQSRVLEAARGIPFGQVASYGEVARRIRRPRAQRAVGNALGRNPLAIVIPCHRVVAAGGRIGGYTGGLDLKRALFGIEGIELGGARSGTGAGH